MKTVSVVPAYGRDYKTAEAAKAAFEGGKDFILKDARSFWDGKPCSVRDLSGYRVEVRYNQIRNIVIVDVP